jgi:hypothetical protein
LRPQDAVDGQYVVQLLDSAATIRRLVAFYVHEHHHVLPQSAFRGQTPDEMYFYEAACQVNPDVSMERLLLLDTRPFIAHGPVGA